MTRALKGRSFEDALKHWSEPGHYAAVMEDDPMRVRLPIEVFYLEKGVDLWELNIQQNRKVLQGFLFRRLAEGSLLSSALSGLADPSHPRSLVHPSIYAEGDVAYDPALRLVIAGGQTLRNVEIFEPRDIPANVTQLPSWVVQYSNQAPSSSAALLPRDGAQFEHDEDYRHVRLRDHAFSLTKTQGQIVKALHEASINGGTWMHLEAIRAAVGFESAKLSLLFRRVGAWRELIDSDQRGYYRLNL